MNHVTATITPVIDQADAPAVGELNENVPMNQKLFLNVNEVAMYVGISRRAVFRAVSGGDLPKPHKLGSRSLWHRPTLERFFAERVGPVVGSQAG